MKKTNKIPFNGTKEQAITELKACTNIEDWNETRDRIKHKFEAGELLTFKQTTKL